jgi:hypothetical protein
MQAISFAVVLLAGIVCFSVGAWTPQPGPTLIVSEVSRHEAPRVVEHFVTIHSTMMPAGALLAAIGFGGWIFFLRQETAPRT